MLRSLVSTICPYCATGCGFYLVVEKSKATGIEYMLEHPSSQGALCPKGNAALEIIDHPERLRYPLKRKGEGFVRISWEEGLDLVPQYKGITKARLGIGGLTWPYASTDHPGTPILHTQGFKLPEGRALMVLVQYKPASESPDNKYPFVLTTGRVAVHHNAGSMTRRSPSLAEREPDLFIEINPIDSGTLYIKNGETMDVSSSHGETTTLARVTDRVKRGVVFMPRPFPGHQCRHHRRQGCQGEDSRIQGCCLQSIPEGIDACLRRCLKVHRL